MDYHAKQEWQNNRETPQPQDLSHKSHGWKKPSKQGKRQKESTLTLLNQLKNDTHISRPLWKREDKLIRKPKGLGGRWDR